jgi:hypothetical protein
VQLEVRVEREARSDKAGVGKAGVVKAGVGRCKLEEGGQTVNQTLTFLSLSNSNLHSHIYNI